MHSIKKRRSACFIKLFHMSSRLCCFPAIFMFTYTGRNSPTCRCADKHSQPGAFSHPVSIKFVSNFRSVPSTAIQQGGVRANSFHEEPQVRRYSATLFGHLCHGGRIHIFGHSDLVSFKCRSIIHFDLGVSGYCVTCLSSTSR